jgi:hypothetical protein
VVGEEEPGEVETLSLSLSQSLSLSACQSPSLARLSQLVPTPRTWLHEMPPGSYTRVCVLVCVRACVRACVCVCVHKHSRARLRPPPRTWLDEMLPGSDTADAAATSVAGSGRSITPCRDPTAPDHPQSGGPDYPQISRPILSLSLSLSLSLHNLCPEILTMSPSLSHCPATFKIDISLPPSLFSVPLSPCMRAADSLGAVGGPSTGGPAEALRDKADIYPERYILRDKALAYPRRRIPAFRLRWHGIKASCVCVSGSIDAGRMWGRGH